ncbi:MAG: hypothetical protein C5S49_03980 [Candidatus Methanogaster sp.]|nr:MAG: hypothetical protein C5S49_03980 [ANME-2 cluster archaeon]
MILTSPVCGPTCTGGNTYSFHTPDIRYDRPAHPLYIQRRRTDTERTCPPCRGAWLFCDCDHRSRRFYEHRIRAGRHKKNFVSGGGMGYQSPPRCGINTCSSRKDCAACRYGKIARRRYHCGARRDHVGTCGSGHECCRTSV